MSTRLYVNILTNNKLISSSDGDQFLNIWIRDLQSFIPEQFGNFEPLKMPFDSKSLQTALDHWKYPFLIKRRTPKMSGSIFMGNSVGVSTHGWIHLILDFQQSQQEEVEHFVIDVAVAFDAEFAFIHPLTKSEFAGRAIPTGVFSLDPKFVGGTLSVTTHDLRKCIPNIYWGTIFGPSYLRLFGREKLLTLGNTCFSTEIKKQMFYVQICPRISGVESDYESFENRRQKVKQHLNSNAFFNLDYGSHHQYSVPKFEHLI